MGDLFDNIFKVLVIPVCFAVMALIWWLILRDTNINLLPALTFALFLLPLVLPFALFYLTYDRWVDYVYTKFKYKNGRATVRIKLPNEVFKSPEAMEMVLRQIHNSSNSDNLMEAYLDGKQPIVNSLELVSIGGDVRFYANVPRKTIKNLLESQLYAQYPGIEVIHEEVDYAAEFQWDPDNMDIMSFHLVKAGDEVLPIKTYIDMKLDQLPKEEEKVEPMSPVIEFLSSLEPHERVVYQIICKPHVKQSFALGTSLKDNPTWKKAAQKKINEIMYRDENRLSIRSEDDEQPDARPSLTMGERDLVAAIERNTGKHAYSVGIRATYITMNKNWSEGIVSRLLKSFFPYDDENRNKIGVRWKTAFDYRMFEDFSGNKQIARKKHELEELKKRSYFQGYGKVNEIHAPTVMSVEELATMFHIPGSVVITPALGRIPSTTGTAPGNLPVGELPI